MLLNQCFDILRVEAFKELMQIELAFPMASMITSTNYTDIYINTLEKGKDWSLTYMVKFGVRKNVYVKRLHVYKYTLKNPPFCFGS